MYYSPITTLYWYFSAAFWIRVAMVAVLLGLGAALAVFLYKTGRIRKRMAVSGFALWLYLLLILFVTVIGRYPSEAHPVRTAPFASYHDFMVTKNPDVLRDIVVNLLMFVPFSFLFAQFIDCFPGEHDITVRTMTATFIAGVVLTLSIEFLQLTTSVGTFDVDDLIHNSIGTLIGLSLWMLWDKWILNNNSGRQP